MDPKALTILELLFKKRIYKYLSVAKFTKIYYLIDKASPKTLNGTHRHEGP